VTWFFAAITALTQVFYTVAPSTLYTRFGRIANNVEALGGLCIIIIIAIGIYKKQKDGWLNITALIIILAAYVHDTLYWTNVINNAYGEIIYAGLFAFLFIQMIIQARRIKLFDDKNTAAELSFMQAQIKPHFLYNAINAFVSISRYDMDRARELLIRFSNYLRRSFDFKDLSQFVMLKNEVELAQAYVDIEKARFEEELEVTFDVCSDLEVKVPILMLQPIIENAINHGVLPKNGGGRVEISINRAGKFVRFSVRDNGVGMETEKLETIKKNYGSGIGLFNIHRRLKKLYGKGLSIRSSIGAGTEITWSVPIA
jgi:sensor histidine kinase YesM